MDTYKLFYLAAKNAYRFKSSKGLITTEDLFNLKLTELDNIAKCINKELKESQEESFINKETKESKLLSNKLELVKLVIKDKLDSQDKAKKALETAKKRRRLAELIESKADKELENKSIDELKKELESLINEEESSLDD